MDIVHTGHSPGPSTMGRVELEARKHLARSYHPSITIHRILEFLHPDILLYVEVCFLFLTFLLSLRNLGHFHMYCMAELKANLVSPKNLKCGF